jgi:hypothetical protein
MTDERQTLGTILRESRTIAVVGLSPRPDRPSHGVAAYLQGQGYRIIPVRPGGGNILGEPSFADLRAAAQAGPIDIVNIFRRSDALPALLDDLLLVHPRLVWMQVGVADQQVRARLESAGIPVVMDRCLMVDHSWLVQA